MCESFQVRNQMAILVKPNWFDILGIQIGSTFTKTVIGDIRNDWLTIIIITVLLLVLALFIAYFFKKIAQVNTETAILSVIPGALSQMLIMAEEDKRANILVVSLTQTSRIIFVVILVPLISYFSEILVVLLKELA